MTKMMKTLKKNKSKTAEPITFEVIEANIDMAQRNFKNSKTSASEAAAYAYFVWRDTMSPHADTYAADWIKTEIEKRNDEISRHNKVENDDRERAEKFALGRLKQAAISKNEQVRLRGLAALDDEAWKLRLKVPIEAREDANAFTKIVKFVFRFDSPADASNTSRYAKVLEWIDAHCATVQGPSEIVSAIKDAGGFDKVIHMQRLVRNGPKAPDTDEKSDNLNILSSTFSKALSEARLQATAKGTVQLEPHEISLAKGQTVSFDNNSRVLLDPAAKVLANGELTVQAPSISVPQGASQKSTSKIPVITNFTVFKRVPFEKGSVLTGWMFLTSVQKYPTEQYCYYTVSSELSGADAVVYIGRDQKPETSVKAPQDIDMIAAFDRCVWFKGENP
jgi:hypothetical protein